MRKKVSQQDQESGSYLGAFFLPVLRRARFVLVGNVGLFMSTTFTNVQLVTSRNKSNLMITLVL